MGYEVDYKWTKEMIEAEIKAMKPKNKGDVVSRGIQEPMFKRGRPKNPELVKTNLDLSEPLLMEIESIASYMGTNRQAVIKHFIVNGLRDYYQTEHIKKKSG